MTQFSSRNHSWRATHEIFIWGQLALLAGVPWLWVMALRGLACGDLWLPPLLELWVLLVPTVGLTAWLQWSKPLSPFSWWFAAVPCQDLTENQLRVFDFLSPKTNPSLATGWLGVLVGITNVVVMSWSLRFLPSLQTESVIDNHFFGVTIALLCLWLANFWLQASVSALRILLAAKSIGEGTSFYTRESVPQDFTHLGIDDVLINWIGVPKKQPFLPPATPPPIVIPSIDALEKARLEAERLALEEQARLEAERLAFEKAEQERLEAERLALEKAEQDRLEAERLALEKAEQERIEAERLAFEKAEQDRLEAERLALEEQARLEAERLALEEQARLEAERLALEEQARLEAE
ncbi:MAG: low-complexity tail membrane protein, partial [Pseudanabaenaceae cyanobacterium]